MSATILLASPHPERWDAFTRAMAEKMPVSTVTARTGAEALAMAKENRPLAAIVDAALGDMSGAALVRRLLGVNAMIHTALVSDQPAEVFHEETEGLGIAMQLPSSPGPDQAARLADYLKGLGGGA